MTCVHALLPQLEKQSKVAYGGKGENLEFVQCLSNDKSKHYDESQNQVVLKLQQTIFAANDTDGAVNLFNETDEDGGGSLDRMEVLHLLTSVGMIGVTLEEVDAIIQSYDVDGSASLGLPEFQLFLKEQAGN